MKQKVQEKYGYEDMLLLHTGEHYNTVYKLTRQNMFGLVHI